MGFMGHIISTASILIASLCFVSNAISSDPYRQIDFKNAGFYLRVPQEWQYFSPNRIYSNVCSIEIRIKSRDDYSNFKEEIEKIEAFRVTLSKTVKENQYYWLQKSESFETGSKIKGLKSVYGYSQEQPSAIAYFFKNGKESFVEIWLKFSTWETKEVWTDIDKTILNGLGLKK